MLGAPPSRSAAHSVSLHSRSRGLHAQPPPQQRAPRAAAPSPPLPPHAVTRPMSAHSAATPSHFASTTQQPSAHRSPPTATPLMQLRQPPEQPRAMLGAPPSRFSSLQRALRFRRRGKLARRMCCPPSHRPAPLSAGLNLLLPLSTNRLDHIPRGIQQLSTLSDGCGQFVLLQGQPVQPRVRR